MTSRLQPLRFSGTVLTHGARVEVNFEAASWGDAIALIDRQYGDDAPFFLKPADVQPG
jgi:hypothetical protein